LTCPEVFSALTGIKTPVGMKLQGTNPEQIQQLGARVQQILSGLPQVRSVFAERVSQGFYLNIEVNRAEAARYGLTIADVQELAAEPGLRIMQTASPVDGETWELINEELLARPEVEIRVYGFYSLIMRSIISEPSEKPTAFFHGLSA